ncbi:MAG: EFR1 family ferrodoxin [Oscillospiraceae bacterium]|nr:EFR1 family ferrodoxin [Oscillospiraceae bacterium]
MATAIYYFSATGNSYTTARLIADGLGDCALKPVASTFKKPYITEEAERVGFVFPVYYGNMPYSVREMISKMTFSKDDYIFIFTTWRGHAGAVAQRMDQLLRTRGQKLSLSLGIPMPGNSFINEPHVDAEHLANQAKNVASLLEDIRNRRAEDYFTADILPSTPIDIPHNFRGITADENCVGCGGCTHVCPRDNIHIENGRAVIGDNCASCLACFHWCPAEAIYMSRQENIARRSKYHHPDVTFSDIAWQKKE